MSYVVRPISDRTSFTGEQDGWPFSALWSQTERLLLDEVAKLKGERLVVEVDVREGDIRLDGRLRANAVTATPAARVAFDSEHGPLTYGTDRYGHWQQNVRAIALGLEALRKVDRYGITKRGEQYTGFKALGGGASPVATAMPPSMSKHAAAELLERLSIGDEGDARQRSVQIILNGDCDMARVVRDARAAAHPDRHAGDHALAYDVDQAARVLGVTR